MGPRLSGGTLRRGDAGATADRRLSALACSGRVRVHMGLFKLRKLTKVVEELCRIKRAKKNNRADSVPDPGRYGGARLSIQFPAQIHRQLATEGQSVSGVIISNRLEISSGKRCLRIVRTSEAELKKIHGS